MSIICGAYRRGKEPCGKQAKQMTFGIIPLCQSHLASVQSEMRIAHYKGHKEAQTIFIDAAVKARRASHDGSMVYFIRAGRRVKIGFSVNPENRLRTIKGGSSKAPVGLDTSKARIVALEPGGIQRERELHYKFSHLREAGEWFRGAPELTAYINELAA